MKIKKFICFTWNKFSVSTSKLPARCTSAIPPTSKTF